MSLNPADGRGGWQRDTGFLVEGAKNCQLYKVFFSRLLGFAGFFCKFPRFFVNRMIGKVSGSDDPSRHAPGLPGSKSSRLNDTGDIAEVALSCALNGARRPRRP